MKNSPIADPQTKETSALEKHIAWFSKNGWVSTSTVEEGFVKLKDSTYTAYKKAIPIMFFSGLRTSGCPFKSFQPKDGIGALNHARDTMLFNPDGSINEDQWLELLKYSESYSGTQIITETKFHEFLNACRTNDTRPDSWPHVAETASNAEWDDFFDKCSDFWKKNGSDYERSVTIATLRKFYDNAPAIFEDVVEGRLPIPRPGS